VIHIEVLTDTGVFVALRNADDEYHLMEKNGIKQIISFDSKFDALTQKIY